MSLPHTTYIICATPRSGSHLLAEAFQVTGVAGKPDEYFITNREGQLENVQGNIANLYGQKTLEEFRDLVFSLGSSPNGVFGIIIQWDYLHHIFNNYRSLPQYKNMSDRALLDALFNNPKFIWLQRRDKVRQAISWIKASHTGIWRVDQEKAGQQSARPAIDYDFFLIEQNVKRYEKAEETWRAFFQQNGIEPFVVVYEELAQSFEKTSLRLLEFLGIPAPEAIEFGERKLKRQASTINEAWANKYLSQKSSLPHRIFRIMRQLRFKLLPS